MAFAANTYRQSLRIAAERDRVAQQRERAEHERARAEEVSSFLVNLFKLSDPEENRGNQVTARELLDSGAKRLQAGLQDQPETKAALLSTVGAVYDSLGQYQDARADFGRVAAAAGSVARRNHASILCWNSAARASDTGDLRGAEQPLQEALHLAQTDFGAKSLESGHSLWSLGMLRYQQGQISAGQGLVYSEPDHFGTAARRRRPMLPSCSTIWRQVYTREQQWVLAKQTYERALDIDRRVLGDDHPRIALRLENLAIVAQNMGELKQAEALYLDALRREEHAYGDRHLETVIIRSNYGLLLQREGRLAEAEPLLRSVLDARLSLLGPDHYMVGYARVSLAMLLHDKGDLPGAESEFRQALAMYDKSLPGDHQYRASLLMHFARLLVDRGKIEEALAKSNESVRSGPRRCPRRARRWRRPTPFTPTRWSTLVNRRKPPWNSKPQCLFC